MFPSVMRKYFLILIALGSPAAVHACEGECIIGITNAFLSNYTTSIHTAFQTIVGQMAAEFFPERRYASPPMFFVKPILDAYHKHAYDRLEHRIFPSYFHGKCQVPNPDNPDAPPANPPGCPNPDCPVVCGTPGSLVHFYSTLRFIVFDETKSHLNTITTPGTEAYQAVEKIIIDEERGGKSQRRRSCTSNVAGTRAPRKCRLEQDHKRRRLQQIFGKLPSILEQKCGGTATDDPNGLPNCSWEKRMKRYILSYP